MPSKACLYNLLVFTKKPERLKKLEPLFLDLLGRFPGKFVSVLQKEGQKEIQMEELPPISLSGSKAQTESRTQIAISGYEEKMVSLVPLPYLMPDLPVILFWLDDNFNSALFQDFYKLADRLLLDGDETAKFQQWLQKLSEGPIPIIDLSWSRGEGWRSVLREVLASEHRRSSLDKCRMLQITYVKGPISTALFFQAWLGTALGFKFKEKRLEGDTLELLYEWKGNNVQVFLSPRELHGIQPGSILNLQFTSSEGEQCLIFRGDDALEVKVHITTAETCDIPFTLYLPNPKRGGSFLNSFIWGDTSNEMLESLPLLQDIL